MTTPAPDEVPSGECVGPTSQQAGKASSCEGCPNQASCASGQAAAQTNQALDQVRSRMDDIKHKILVLSGKGGVGKSTISTQLAWTLNAMDYQVGMLDIDICGPTVPRMMGVEGQDVKRGALGWQPVYTHGLSGLDLAVMSIGFMLGSRDDAVVWRGPRKDALIKQFLTEVDWGKMDFLVVDAPPGTSDEHISIAQYLKGSGVDGAVIVTTPQEVSLLAVRKEINFCKKVGIPIIGVVENMAHVVCPCCQKQSPLFPATNGGARKMAEDMKVPFLGSLPHDAELLASCEAGQCYVTAHPRGSVAAPFQELVKKILSAIKAEPPTMNTESDSTDTPLSAAPPSSTA